MSVKAINSNIDKRNNIPKKQQQTAFTGSFNPVVTLMDAIDKGGFAASFIAQDGIGMVAPRIYEGLNRNRQKDENGNKTGPLNWEFARREGIREILSGPSAFLIPLGIISVIKKASGTANNVHVSHIKALGQEFATYVAENPEKLVNSTDFRQGYYTRVFKNTFENSLDKNLTDNKINIDETAENLAKKLVDSENLRANKNKKAASKLKSEIIDDFMNLRKQYAAPSSNELGASIKVGDKSVGTSINKLTESLTDYTKDALKNTTKFIKENSSSSVADLVKEGKLTQFIEKFNTHRSGTRVLTNLGMWGAVVAFYTLIPKLYNLGLKSDPGLKGLVDENNNTNEQNKKDVAFTGGFFAKTGKIAMSEGSTISNLLKNFEFNGATMPVPAMLTLLFGFCLPPRYINAKSDKEKKEIAVRDISSFTAILFGAKALSRGFSDIFAKISGFALNIKPENHNKGILHKVKNYFTAGNGIDVLTSQQITSKYSDLKGYNNGINGFFKFIQENGGDIKKLLSGVHKEVKQYSETIVKEFSGKSLKDASIKEIEEAFEKAKGSEALEKIYTIFSNKDNKFINRAKTFNSAFGFASTLVLVPAFMMWLARYCERMTKDAIAKEKELAKANEQPVQRVLVTGNKPTMAGFLSK